MNITDLMYMKMQNEDVLIFKSYKCQLSVRNCTKLWFNRMLYFSLHNSSKHHIIVESNLHHTQTVLEQQLQTVLQSPSIPYRRREAKAQVVWPLTLMPHKGILVCERVGQTQYTLLYSMPVNCWMKAHKASVSASDSLPGVSLAL